MLNPEDLRIEIIRNINNVDVYPKAEEFIKVTHEPSGICVTKHNRSQIKAKDEALEELELLVELYNER